MLDDSTDADLLLAAIQSEVAKIRTALPGRVVSYDHATQRATIGLAVRSKVRDPLTGAITNADTPLIPNVPILFPGGTGYAVTFPLTAGDPVLVLVCERSLDEWKATGNASNDAQDVRRFNLSDAVAIPGSISPAQPIGTAGRDAAAIVVQGVAVKLGSSLATEGVLKGTTFEAHLSTWNAGMAALLVGLATGNLVTIAAAAVTFQAVHATFLAQVAAGHTSTVVKAT